MKLEIKINTAGFRTMTAELARLSGRAYGHVLRLEAASSIKIAALGSKVASLASIRNRVLTRDSSRLIRTFDGRVLLGRDTKGEGHVELITINHQRDEGRVWFLYLDAGTNEEKKHLVFDAGPSRGHRLPAPIWDRYLALAGALPAAQRALLADLKARRALERQSWLQMADGLQVDLATVAPQGNLQTDLAREASVRGRRFANGSGWEQGEGARFFLHVRNTSPVAIRRGGQARLDGAVNRRVKNFERAVKQGYILDLQTRAKRWPGIFVRPA